MNRTPHKKKDLIALLAQAKQDFRFDPKIKTRLMLEINSRHLSHNDLQNFAAKPIFPWQRAVFAAGIFALIFAGGTGLALAGNQAAPGDTLFPIQKFQNHVILTLPLPETKKEEIRTNIAAKRIDQLNRVQNNPQAKPKQVQAALEEAQLSMSEAVSHLDQPQNSNEDTDQGSKTASDSKKQQKLEKLISKLEKISSEHEKSLEQIRQKIKDQEELAEKLDKSVESIRNNRQKLIELRSGVESEDSEPDDSPSAQQPTGSAKDHN